MIYIPEFGLGLFLAAQSVALIALLICQLRCKDLHTMGHDTVEMIGICHCGEIHSELSVRIGQYRVNSRRRLLEDLHTCGGIGFKSKHR